MIRKAKASEIEEIITITKACAAHMISNGIYQWNEEYPSKKAFLNDLKRGELFVYISEESITGCIVISDYKDTEYNEIKWLTPDRANYYIHRLAVHPNKQGQGYAKQLMDFAEDHIAKMNGRSVRLDTFSGNERNQRFYEARGYRKLGPIYFPRQSDLCFHCYELLL